MLKHKADLDDGRVGEEAREKVGDSFLGGSECEEVGMRLLPGRGALMNAGCLIAATVLVRSDCA